MTKTVWIWPLFSVESWQHCLTIGLLNTGRHLCTFERERSFVRWIFWGGWWRLMRMIWWQWWQFLLLNFLPLGNARRCCVYHHENTFDDDWISSLWKMLLLLHGLKSGSISWHKIFNTRPFERLMKWMKNDFLLVLIVATLKLMNSR